MKWKWPKCSESDTLVSFLFAICSQIIRFKLDLCKYKVRMQGFLLGALLLLHSPIGPKQRQAGCWAPLVGRQNLQGENSGRLTRDSTVGTQAYHFHARVDDTGRPLTPLPKYPPGPCSLPCPRSHPRPSTLTAQGPPSQWNFHSSSTSALRPS